MFKRISYFTYGLASYGIFFLCFLYAIGFVGNLWVPKSIDAVPTAPFITSLIIDVLLLGLFAVQHSVMARPAFKRAWTRIIPKELERSTYVLFSSLALFALFAFWQPLGGLIWQVEDFAAQTALYSVSIFGWALVLVSTFLINHFDLFGLRQVTLYLMGREYSHIHFRTTLLYKNVRHPIYLGFILAFWATPVMTATHLLFAIATTGYILIGIQLEERDLKKALPEYDEYSKRVPMLIPSIGNRTDDLIKTKLQADNA
ncbi:MAG: isoprenylcysteine carboxylmethyltransferase family protein [Gammaproteobacteria bacterium]|nr:isoprenylcysteine carboxylmethyltransferase family protein [Gammaproteobacteria bacterium]